jgi:inner membrane protease subunit 2
VRHGNLGRGDVVVLISPRDPNHILIKRIIGLEGDTVSLRKRTNDSLKSRFGRECVIIPSGHCWLEGDHGEKSLDSNVFGPVPLGLVFAKATHIIWPHNRWMRLEAFYDRSRVRPEFTSILAEDEID